MSTHKHALVDSHAADDLNGASAVHEHRLLSVLPGHEVPGVGVDLPAFPSEVGLIIDHQLSRGTTAHT